ncbi:hypothetical protein DFH09DRAFT_1353342 [Mycena vulgaris]|nr:hypothetical protein DFH09DRAFT_1353342 [Mycena vulgaris]
MLVNRRHLLPDLPLDHARPSRYSAIFTCDAIAQALTIVGGDTVSNRGTLRISRPLGASNLPLMLHQPRPFRDVDDHLLAIAQACTRSQRPLDLLVVRRHPNGTVIAHGNLSPASQRPYLPPPHPSFHRRSLPSSP